MAKPYNRAVSKEEILSNSFQVRNKATQENEDISTWEFHFTLTDSDDVVIWDITNGLFTRPDNYTISFEKTVAQVAAVDDGFYTISLLVTNSTMTDYEWINGTWQFKS